MIYHGCYALILCFICACFSACKKADTPVVYSSVDGQYAREILKNAESADGEEPLLIVDTEAAKSTGILNRLIAEKERPVADIFLSGDPIRAARLRSLGIAEDDGYEGCAWRFRLLIYNKDTVQKEQVPQSLFDLAKPEFAPKACLANPQFGTTSMHFAWMYQRYGRERVLQFLEAFTKNGGKMVASNGEVRRRVSSGEFAYGLTDSDDFSVALSDGKPVGFVIPDLASEGILIIPTVAVKIVNCPHPEQADKLLAYLRSPAMERILAESEAAHIPNALEIPEPEHFKGVRDLKKISYDATELAEQMVKMAEDIDQWVARQ